MEEIRKNVRRNKGLFWVLEIFYLGFAGCVSFPLRPDPGQMAVLLIGMVIMAALLPGLVERSVIKAWGLALVCVAAGLAVRYALMPGGEGDRALFTPANLGLFLAAVPAAFAGVYALAARR